MDHEIKSKIFFPNFIFTRELLYLSVDLRPENEKILAHDIEIQENSQTKADTFENFHVFSYSHASP